MRSSGWIGVDLDGTLAYYDKFRGIDHIGEPILKMLNFVKKLLSKGHTVKIFTARAKYSEAIPYIQEWLKENGIPDLEITNVKDFAMWMLLDDRCVQVEKNTGRLIGEFNE